MNTNLKALTLLVLILSFSNGFGTLALAAEDAEKVCLKFNELKSILDKDRTEIEEAQPYSVVKNAKGHKVALGLGGLLTVWGVAGYQSGRAALLAGGVGSYEGGTFFECVGAGAVFGGVALVAGALLVSANEGQTPMDTEEAVERDYTKHFWKFLQISDPRAACHYIQRSPEIRDLVERTHAAVTSRIDGKAATDPARTVVTELDIKHVDQKSPSSVVVQVQTSTARQVN